MKPKPVAAEEFERFDPEWRYDLIEGELRPMPPMPGEEHGDIANLFTVYAGIHVLQNRLGKCFAAATRFIIQRNPDTGIGPDWAFIAKERLPQKRGTGFIPIVPDAVLEVRSPGDEAGDVQNKVYRRLQAGVRIVWEIDPQTKTLTIHRPDVSAQTLTDKDTLSARMSCPVLPFRFVCSSGTPTRRHHLLKAHGVTRLG